MNMKMVIVRDIHGVNVCFRITVETSFNRPFNCRRAVTIKSYEWRIIAVEWCNIRVDK